jgi:hypothetical protein
MAGSMPPLNAGKPIHVGFAITGIELRRTQQRKTQNDETSKIINLFFIT